MRIHLIAIGGSIMHSLAIELKRIGHRVTGSDDIIYDPARSRLNDSGLLPVTEGWNPETIRSDIDLIILGMHAKDDNPELIRAQELGLKIQSFPEFLGEFSQDKMVLAICGSHGKTTTTSMVMNALAYAGVDFDFAVGASLEGFDNPTRLSGANIFVVEGDEYLSSCLDRRPKFIHYHANYAIITGIAWDHVNVFPTYESYCQAFVDLIRSTDESAVVFYNNKDEALSNWVKAQKSKKLKPYRQLGLTSVNGEIYYKKSSTIQLPFFGRHNLENTLGAWSLVSALGMNKEVFVESLMAFRMPDRRLNEYRNGDQIVIKDFAHAPSKVKASVQAVREKYPGSKLKVLLELHTYSSLNKGFIGQYKDSLLLADEAGIFYNPVNLRIKGLVVISPDEIRTAFNQNDLQVFEKKSEVERFAVQATDNEVLLLMSSSNFGGADLRVV